MRKIALLFSFLACVLLIGSISTAYAQKKNDKEDEYREPIPTPSETNHILITYRLDGSRAIYIYFGNTKADLIIVPKLDLDELNGKKMGISENGVVANFVVDLLNRYDKEGFELVSTETYVPIAAAAGNMSPSWTQCFLKKKTP